MSTIDYTKIYAVDRTPVTLYAIEAVARMYWGYGSTLECSACSLEAWAGDTREGEEGNANRERIQNLLGHTAFDHATRADVLVVRRTVDIRWEA